MTVDEDRELTERLRRAYRRTPDPAQRRQQLEVVHAAVRAARPRRWGWRQRLVLGVALTLLLLPGLGLAAERAVPGDTLYPVKRLTERIVAVVDPDVVAEHRLDEAERLLRSDRPRDQLEAHLEQVLEQAGREVARRRRRVELAERYVALALEAAQHGVDLPLERLPTLAELERLRRRDRSPTLSPTAPPPTGPQPSPTAPASPPPAEASPTPPPPPPADQARVERFAVRDAGVVRLEIRRDGLRLVAVEPAPGWTWRADRSREPAAVRVGFTDGTRLVVFLAEHTDGGYRIHIEEHTRTTDQR